MKIKALLILLFLLLPFNIYSLNKTALLIANGHYDNFSSLANPVPEARLMRDALKRLGFDVTMITDASREQMLESLTDFEDAVKSRGGIALFHYGGHAVQVDGRNYLIPSAADIPDESRVRTRAVDAEEVMLTLENSGSDTNIVILDSCRNNPLPAGAGRSASRGLAVVGREPPNSIIVYSARSGQVAQDGIFTPTLVSFLEMPGLSFSEIVRKTRQTVYNKTNGSQTPGSYDQLFEPVYLAGEGGLKTTVRPVPQNIPEGFVLVEAGTFTMGSPGDERSRDEDEALHRVTLTRSFYMAETEVTQGLWEKIMGLSARQQLDKKNNSQNTKWEMRGEGYSFPVYYISWKEAVAFCNEMSRRDGLTPCYSGFGSQTICNFAADGYRLPTEAEWEYAARGGNKAGRYKIYAGSDNMDDVGWYRSNSNGSTHQVGQKSANALGLYDMSGNVWEWCWDWWAADYPQTEIDPAGPATGTGRAARGGSWGGGDYKDPASDCRSASRITFYDYFCGPVGFRLVRTVTE